MISNCFQIFYLSILAAMLAAFRDELFDSQEGDDEENNIPGAGSSNDMNIQVS